MTLLEIADLSEVWIEADVYEKDIAMIHKDMAIEATVAALSGQQFQGKVAIVSPQVDAATRTTRVRFQLSNPKSDLRPGMFATVEIEAPLSEIEPTKSQLATPSKQDEGKKILAVPEQSVIDTGTKQVVYVEREPGVFEGVEVKLGPRDGELYPVLRGLKAGDRVAAAGAFLIDAETRLNPGAAATYYGASGGPSKEASGNHQHHLTEEEHHKDTKARRTKMKKSKEGLTTKTTNYTKG